MLFLSYPILGPGQVPDQHPVLVLVVSPHHIYIYITFFSRPTPIGGPWASHWLNKGGREGGRTLSSTNREPECSGGSFWWDSLSDYTRARPGHRAVSIRMDCVLVFRSNHQNDFFTTIFYGCNSRCKRSSSLILRPGLIKRDYTNNLLFWGIFWNGWNLCSPCCQTTHTIDQTYCMQWGKLGGQRIFLRFIFWSGVKKYQNQITCMYFVSCLCVCYCSVVGQTLLCINLTLLKFVN